MAYCTLCMKRKLGKIYLYFAHPGILKYLQDAARDFKIANFDLNLDKEKQNEIEKVNVDAPLEVKEESLDRKD